VQWDKHGKRILLGDNTGSRVVMLQPLRFQCVGVRISTGLVHKCIADHTYTQFNLHHIFQNMNTAKFGDCLYCWPFKFSSFSVSPRYLILAQKG
jgi:hypothetical protein